MECLQSSMAASLNMQYVNTTLDVVGGGGWRCIKYIQVPMEWIGET